MATLGMPSPTARQRSVSPLGESRFERPYSPPRNKHTSPATPSSGSQAHWAQGSVASTHTQSTAPTTASTTSVRKDSKETASFSPVCPLPEEPDEWFARFHSDPDLTLGVSDKCPDRATLAAVYDIPIYSADGSGRPFGSVFDPLYATHQRQLVLFVRHFYCGACQAYLRTLTDSITMQEYFSIPTPTSIIIIGCGEPDLIPQYKKFTNCPFPIFADPNRQLFKKLGMTVSLNIGNERPEYMKDISAPAWLAGQVTTIRKSLKDPEGIRKRDIFRGGNPMQIGGEFLFDDGEAVWCHRMKNYRNHAEVTKLRKLLELDE